MKKGIQKGWVVGVWAGLVCFLGSATSQAMGTAPLKGDLAGFVEPDTRGEQALQQINGKAWIHLREFQASPDDIHLQLVHFADLVRIEGSTQNLRMESRAEKGGVVLTSLFVTGTEIAHIENVFQRVLADGTIQLLYVAQKEPFIYENGPLKRIERARVNPGFFTLLPNYDAIRTLQWALYYRNHRKLSNEEIFSMEFLVIQFNPAAPKSLRLIGYRDSKSEPETEDFELCRPGQRCETE